MERGKLVLPRKTIKEWKAFPNTPDNINLLIYLDHIAAHETPMFLPVTELGHYFSPSILLQHVNLEVFANTLLKYNIFLILHVLLQKYFSILVAFIYFNYKGTPILSPDLLTPPRNWNRKIHTFLSCNTLQNFCLMYIFLCIVQCHLGHSKWRIPFFKQWSFCNITDWAVGFFPQLIFILDFIFLCSTSVSSNTVIWLDP